MLTRFPTPPGSMLPLIYLVILGSIWGLHFSVIKLAAESGLPYSGIVALTTAGAAIAMVVIAFIRGRMPVLTLKHLRFYFLCAVLGYVVAFFIELYSAARLPASVLTLIVCSTPVFTVVIALVAGTDRVSTRTLVSILVGGLAAGVLVVPAAIGYSGLPIGWIAVAFVVPLIYAIYHNYVSHAWPEDSDTFQVACGESLAALCLLLPVFLIRGSFSEFQGDFGYGHLAMIIMVAFSVIEIYLYFEIVRLAGPVFVSQANFVTVVTGVAWGMVIFQEQPTRWIALSAVLLGLALYLGAGQRAAIEE